MSPQSGLLETAFLYLENFPEFQFCLFFFPTSSSLSGHLRCVSGNIKTQISRKTYCLETYKAKSSIGFTIWKIFSSKVATSKLPTQKREFLATFQQPFRPPPMVSDQLKR